MLHSLLLSSENGVSIKPRRFSLANRSLSVPAGWRLYLPKEWMTDRERCFRAGVPFEVVFLKKWEIALELIDGLLDDDVPRAPVVADSGYGDATAFRDALTGRGLKYVLGVKGDATVWPSGLEPEREPRDNARFVITNVQAEPQVLYHRIYAKRGDVENRLKELHDGVALDRLSCTSFLANHERLLMHAAAFVLYQELRLHASGTDLALVQVTTLRERLIKLGG